MFWNRADHVYIRLYKTWHRDQQSLQTFLLLTWLSPPFLNISPPFFERLILSTRSYQLSEKANRLPFLLPNVVLTVYQKSTSYARTSVLFESQGDEYKKSNRIILRLLFDCFVFLTFFLLSRDRRYPPHRDRRCRGPYLPSDRMHPCQLQNLRYLPIAYRLP